MGYKTITGFVFIFNGRILRAFLLSLLCLSAAGFGQARVFCLQLFTQTSFSTDSCLVIPFDFARAFNNFWTHERISVHVAFAWVCKIVLMQQYHVDHFNMALSSGLHIPYFFVSLFIGWRIAYISTIPLIVEQCLTFNVLLNIIPSMFLIL